MLGIETLKLKISDFLNSNTCFYSIVIQKLFQLIVVIEKCVVNLDRPPPGCWRESYGILNNLNAIHLNLTKNCHDLLKEPHHMFWWWNLWQWQDDRTRDLTLELQLIPALAWAARAQWGQIYYEVEIWFQNPFWNNFFLCIGCLVSLAKTSTRVFSGLSNYIFLCWKKNQVRLQKDFDPIVPGNSKSLIIAPSHCYLLWLI